MKKMKRFLVAMLGGLTAIACLAGISACKKDKEEAKVEEKPSYDININVPGLDVEKCVHDYSVVYYEQKADCFNGVEGYKEMGCSKCGTSITVYTGMGHDYGTASCTEPASCLLCGEQKNIVTAAHKMVAATCTAPASCSECDYTEGEALGHKEGAFTCVDGSSCEVCGVVIKEAHNIVSAFGSLVVDGWFEIEEEDILSYDDNGYAYIDSTCDTVGYEGFSFCETCLLAWADQLDVENEVFDEETALDFYLFWFDLLEDEDADASDFMNYLFGENGVTYAEGYKTIAPKHNYVDFFTGDALESGNYIDPTCTENGLKNFKACADCAEIDFASLTTEAEIAAAVTLAEDAERPAIYAVDYSAAVVAKLGHTSIDAEGNNSFVAGKPATCVEYGTQWTAECARCGVEMNEFIDVDVEPLGHDYNGKEPTCFKAVNCINCGEEWSRNHVLSDVKVELAKAPTCTEAGYENVKVCTYEDCTYCEFTSIPMLNHSWTAYSEAADKESVTCVEGLVAKNVYKCDTCEQFSKLASNKYTITTSIYEVKPLTTHTKSDAFVDATCESAAQNVACTVPGCPAEEAFAKAALGHKFATAATTATCFQDGKCTRENCDRADGVVPAFEHYNADGKSAKVTIDAEAPTCTKTGYVEHEQCTLCKTLFFNGEMEVTVGYDAEGNPVKVKHSTTAGGTLFLDKVSHVYEKVAEKLPTCQEAGYSAHEVCVNCGNKAGYTTNGYAKKACASDIASCYDFVACNHSYVVIKGTDVIVAKDAKYVLDYYTAEYRLATAAEIEAGKGENGEDILDVEWRGCGELTKTTNKIACVTHNKDGNCVVCDKVVGHKYNEDGDCECGATKED